MFNKLKHRIAQKLIGNFYTELEVFKLMCHMQYDMAQYAIGNSDERVVPIEYMEKNGKYKIDNIYTHFD